VWKALTRGSHTCIAFFDISVWRKRSRGSLTHELVRLRVVKGACVKALVRALWSLGEWEAHALCMFAQVGFWKDLWI
jgi:hypothetical protein